MQRQFLEKGMMFRHYQVMEKIGQGGMGAVFKVLDTKWRRVVALKIMTGQIDKVQSKRFVEEVKATARLHHEHIVKLFEAGTDPVYYFTMEYIEGKTLDAYSKELSHEQIVEILHKVANALYHAHCKGFVHRDIKPANILVDANLNPKVTDFGLAKNLRIDSSLSQTGEIIGTPKYVAPEQITNGNIDKRSDIFSLGIMMYEFLAQKYPFRYEENNICATLLYQIANKEPTPLQQITKIKPDLATICHTCIAKEPKKRYKNMRYLARDLECYLKGIPIKIKMESWSYKAYCKLKESVFLTTGFLFMLVLLCILAIPFTHSNLQKNQKDQVAQTVEEKEIKRYSILLNWCNTNDQDFVNKASIYQTGIWLEPHSIQKSLQWLEQQKQKAPNDASLYYQEIYVQIINGFVDSNDWTKSSFRLSCKKALKLLKDANLKNEMCENLLVFIKISEYAINKKQGKQAVFTVNPKNPYSCWFYTFTVDDVWEKEKFLLQAISLKQDMRFFRDLLVIYTSHDLLEETIELGKHCTALFPYDMHAYYHLAHAYISLGEYDKGLYYINLVDADYEGGRRDLVYYEKLRVCVIQNNFSGAYEILENLEKWQKKHSALRETHQVWQKVVYEINGNFNASQNILADKDETVNQKIIKIKTYKEFKRFDLAQSEYNKIKKVWEKYKRPYQKKITREYLFAAMEKLNSDFSNADLISEIYSPIVEKINQEAQKNLAVIWGRKFVQLLVIGRHNKKCEQHLKLFYDSDFFQKKMPNDLKNYDIYYKMLAHLEYVSPNYLKTISFYNSALPLMKWNKQNIINHRDYILARIYFYDKQDSETARRIISNILQVDSNFTQGYILLGAIETKNQNHLEATKYFSKVNEKQLTKRDYMDFLYDLAALSFSKKEYDATIKISSKYILLDNVSGLGYLVRGLAYQGLKEYEKALQNFDLQISTDAENHLKSYQRKSALLELWAHEITDQKKKKTLYIQALETWQKTPTSNESEEEQKKNKIQELKDKIASF